MYQSKNEYETLRDQLIKKILKVLPDFSWWKGVKWIQSDNLQTTEAEFMLDLENYNIKIVETSNFELGRISPHPVSYMIYVYPTGDNRSFFSAEVWVEDEEFSEFKEHMIKVREAIREKESNLDNIRKENLLRYLMTVNDDPN